MFFISGDTESTDMTDEDDASSAKLMKNNEASGTITTAYDECKGILKILNGDDQQHQQHEQEYIENKSIIENCEIKGESDDDDDVDFNEDKINGEENEELDHDSMLMLNGKWICFTLIRNLKKKKKKKSSKTAIILLKIWKTRSYMTSIERRSKIVCSIAIFNGRLVDLI